MKLYREIILISIIFLAKGLKNYFKSESKSHSPVQPNPQIKPNPNQISLYLYFLGFAISYQNITSPNYPNNYPNNQNLEWVGGTKSGYVLGFKFGTFELEEGYDWVKITDDISGRVLFYNDPYGAASGKQRQRLVFYNLQRTFASDSNRVRIRFYTDYSVTKKGFLLNVWVRQKSKLIKAKYFRLRPDSMMTWWLNDWPLTECFPIGLE